MAKRVKIHDLIYEPPTYVNATAKQVAERLEPTKSQGYYIDKPTGILLYNEAELPTAEVVAHRKKRTINDNFQAAYNRGVPSGTMSADLETMNAVTGGVMNLLSPSQIIGAAVHSDKPQDYFLNLMKGNSGVVTDKFAEEHPYWGIGINSLFDVTALGLGSSARNIANSPGRVANSVYKNTVGNVVGAKIYSNILKTSKNDPEVLKMLRRAARANELDFRNSCSSDFKPGVPLFTEEPIIPSKFNPNPENTTISVYNPEAVVETPIGINNKIITIQGKMPRIKNGKFQPFKGDSNFDAIWWKKNEPYYKDTTDDIAIICDYNPEYEVKNTTRFGQSPSIVTTGEYPIQGSTIITTNPITGFIDKSIIFKNGGVMNAPSSWDYDENGQPLL